MLMMLLCNDVDDVARGTLTVTVVLTTMRLEHHHHYSMQQTAVSSRATALSRELLSVESLYFCHFTIFDTICDIYPSLLVSQPHCAFAAFLYVT